MTLKIFIAKIRGLTPEEIKSELMTEASKLERKANKLREKASWIKG